MIVFEPIGGAVDVVLKGSGGGEADETGCSGYKDFHNYLGIVG